jgi:phage terminase large subunit-like protein
MRARRFALAADLLDPPHWQPEGRPPPLDHQRPPDGDWSLWLLEGGRGSGKTEACARYFAAYMRRHPGHRGRIIAPTFDDAVQACIEGPSGLKSVDPAVVWRPGRVGGSIVSWPNGSEALVLGTPTPRDVNRLRAGGNRHLDWWEEMAANPMLHDSLTPTNSAWDQAQLGLRMGEHPHSIASTTPRATAAYKYVRAQPNTVRVRATMFDNPHNPEEWVRTMRARYEGTRLGRQELAGELIEDSERALVRRAWIDGQRVDQPPAELVRMRAVGLDPGGKNSQALVMVGAALDNRLYVERSEMVDASAADFLRHAVRIAHGHGAMLVVEKNHGGDYLIELLGAIMRELGTLVAVRTVWASVGKRARAEPVALLIEQGKVKWVGAHAQLEDEWCSWEPDSSESPHLIDAHTWANSALVGSVAMIGHEHELEAVPFQ